MFFFRKDLIGKAYEWPDIKNDVTKASPGMGLFDPFNGNQLLYMINFFSVSVGCFSISHGQKVERLIGTLPPDVKSEIAVFNWLRGKFLNYWNENA